jgi:hypothetical protein
LSILKKTLQTHWHKNARDVFIIIINFLVEKTGILLPKAVFDLTSPNFLCWSIILETFTQKPLFTVGLL